MKTLLETFFRIFTALKAHGHSLTVHTAKSKVPNESPTMASTPASTGVMDVFNDYADYITAEQQIREVHYYILLYVLS